MDYARRFFLTVCMIHILKSKDIPAINHFYIDILSLSQVALFALFCSYDFNI